MRIWQKIYLTTLLLFLFMLNMGLFIAARFLFSHTIKAEVNQGETDCYFLCQNLEHDFAILAQNGRRQEQVITLVLKGYQDYYRTKNIEITLEKTSDSKRAALGSNVMHGGRQMEVFVEQNLSAPYDQYHIRYRKRLTDFEATWSAVRHIFALISLVTSLALCLILYLLTQRMLKPLDKLNENVARIAAGRYEDPAEYAADTPQTLSRKKTCGFYPFFLKLWKKDEIEELSQNVNKMACTIQNQIHALEEESVKKQLLLDNMAHELRTPLTSIFGYAEYLKCAKATNEETYEGLTYIMEESRRLAKMSETMLSMRLYETEPEQSRSIDLSSLACHVEKILSENLREKRLSLEKNFKTEQIYGEEALLISLFRNLLENAIRASKPGEIIIWNIEANHNMIRSEITDHGIGMEQAELEKITEAFYRVDKARSRKDGGCGLGLSIVDLIVQKMGGYMTFSSTPQKGTTVILQFPNNPEKTN